MISFTGIKYGNALKSTLVSSGNLHEPPHLYDSNVRGKITCFMFRCALKWTVIGRLEQGPSSRIAARGFLELCFKAVGLK